MESRIIRTEAGDVRVATAGPDVLAALAAWPKPIREVRTRDGSIWSIVFEDDAGEMVGLRVHYGYHRQHAEAVNVASLQRAVLAPAVVRLAREGFRGALLPAVFMSGPKDGPFMTGHAIFGRSTAVSHGGLDSEPLETYERILGAGGTNLALSFLRYAEEAWKTAGIPPRAVSDLDFASRDECGSLALDLMLADGHLVCLHRTLDDAHRCRSSSPPPASTRWRTCRRSH